MQTCATCSSFAAKEKQCRSKPPNAALVPGPSGITGPTLNVIGFWPTVEPDGWCSEWKPRALAKS